MSTESIHIPYPDTKALKAAKGTFLMHMKNHPRYDNRTKVAFHGTVKIHGTNITIIFKPGGVKPQIQSRNNFITPENDDGYGSAAFISPYVEIIKGAVKPVIGNKIVEVMIAGELAGEGINLRQAATSDLERFYVIFAIRVNGVWLDRRVWQHVVFPTTTRIYNIHQFKTYNVVVDFKEDRAVGGGKIIKDLCLEVERECPVALQLGIKNGRGEGIVWTEEREQKYWSFNPLVFKSKGPAFENGGNIAPAVDNKGTLGMIKNGTNESAVRFVQQVVTMARLEQGLESIREELSRGRAALERHQVLKNRGNINKLSDWLMKDILKEDIEQMKNLGLDRGLAKNAVKEEITMMVKVFFNA